MPKKPWSQMTDQQRQRERDRQRLRRQLRYDSDPAYRERQQAKIAALRRKQGRSTDPGPSGWPG